MDYVASSEDYTPKLFWVAISKNGFELHQRDGHNSEAIDRRNLKTIVLVDADNNPVLTQHFKSGQQLIYRNRTAMQEGRGTVERIHILGWQQGDARHVAFVYESSKHIELGDFIPDGEPTDRPWLYPINIKDYDLIAVE